MSLQPNFDGPQPVSSVVANCCPPWCEIRHGSHGGEDDHVHISSALLVKRTVLQLAASIDPDTGAQDGPIVYVGDEEYTLDQVEVLIDALKQLIDQGTVDQGTQGTALGTGERPAQKFSDG